MGYKLAGFDVIGMNEIDPRMAEAYITNHNPKHAFIEPIQDFVKRDSYPAELYDLDILDGSPPCSSFSMAGNREKDWGKDKKFREGQAEQVLDTLFFDFIDLAKKLQPKIVVAENVKGLLLGAAMQYVSKIIAEFNNAGYYVDYALIDSSTMGVPQKRERVFFFAIRKDCFSGNFSDLFKNIPFINMRFDCKPIPFSDISDNKDTKKITHLASSKLWAATKPGKNFGSVHEKGSFFNNNKVNPNKPLPTIAAKDGTGSWHHSIQRLLNTDELIKGGSFPSDYDFCGSKPKYIIGMSVPPIMIANIADRIYDQWLNNE